MSMEQHDIDVDEGMEDALAGRPNQGGSMAYHSGYNSGLRMRAALHTVHGPLLYRYEVGGVPVTIIPVGGHRQ